MHFEKYTKDKAIMLIKHDTRQYKKHANINIDTERSERNFKALYNAPESPLTAFNQKYKEICILQKETTNRAVRSDAVALCEWVITKPENVPLKDSPKFFRHAAEFLANRYGIENVICAQVHMDETTPHMHFNFMPIRGRNRLCAKDLETRQSLSQLHKDIQKYISIQMGYNVNMLTGETPKRSLHIAQYKAQKIIEEAENVNLQLINAQKTVEKVELLNEFLNVSAEYDREYTNNLLQEAQKRIQERRKEQYKDHNETTL